MRFRGVVVPRITLTKQELTADAVEKFRDHWKFYCKTISPFRAERYLIQSFPELDLWDIKTMYKEWRKEYLESGVW